MSTTWPTTLIKQLDQEGFHIPPELTSNIETYRHPWFLRLILDFCGWLAAMFLLGSLDMLLPHVFNQWAVMLGLGCIFSLVAMGIAHLENERNDLAQQFSVAIAIAGLILLLLGFGKLIDSHYNEPMTFAVAGILFLLNPNEQFRFLSSSTAIGALLVWLAPTLASTLMTPLLMLITILWLYEGKWRCSSHASLWRNPAYAAVVLMLWGIMQDNDGTLNFWRSASTESPESHLWLQLWTWAGRILQWLLLLVTATQLLHQQSQLAANKATFWSMAGILLLCGISFWAPGLLPISLVLLLGMARGNRILLGLASVTLIWYLGHYYYSLHISLLHKSVVLIVAGICLLLARSVLLWVWPVENKQ